ncbi:hypothetical protein [Nocardioides sp.]|uniref:hypothetical protein n=1 Tax=Nocardioides sp. TaxID=35761 RepID=UPI0035170A6E
MKLLLVVLLFAVVVYVATRLLQERGQGGTGGTPSLRRPSRPGPPTRPVAPDDDETFLRDLDWKRRQQQRRKPQPPDSPGDA